MKIVKCLLISLILLFGCPQVDTYAQSKPTRRCEATTKKGTRCKNEAVGKSKYCQVHYAKSLNVKQCKAKTKSGDRCSRAAKHDGYCTQHYKKHHHGHH